MLVILSLLYLAAPYYLFAAGMLRGGYAVAFCVILTCAVGRVIRNEWGRGHWQGAERRRATFRCVLWTAAVSLVAVVWMGAGGLGLQETDWAKHNAVLYDLTTRPWPVAYPARGRAGEEYLTYYLAYYLPAAAVGKLGGLLAAHLSLTAWTWTGFLLAAAWLFRLVGRAWWWLLPAFLLLSGLDVLGAVLPSLPFGTYNYFEWWAKFAQYSSNLTLLAWVPQHALSGWIATSLILDQVERRSEIADLGLFSALCSLWSPFVTLGLVPVVLVASWRTRFRGMPSFSNGVAGPVILLLSVVYFRSVDSGRVPHSWIIQNGFLVGQADFLIDLARGIPLLVLFWILEFGLYLILLKRLVRSLPEKSFPGAAWTDTWLAMIGVTLTLLPAYRIGENNDLAMRASIPTLFLLWILLLRAFSAGSWKFPARPARALAVCLAIASLQPLFQLAMHVKHTNLHLQYTTVFPRQADEDRDVYRLVHEPPTAGITDLKNAYYFQYVGQPDSFFYRHLARRAEPVPHTPTDAAVADHDRPDGGPDFMRTADARP